MKTIHKFTLTQNGSQTIEMPRGAKILHCAPQHGEVQLWALVNTDEPKVTRFFWIIGTGQEMPDVPLKYVGTVQITMWVWHIFEEAA